MTSLVLALLDILLALTNRYSSQNNLGAFRLVRVNQTV